jgi:hypothetical protein
MRATHPTIDDSALPAMDFGVGVGVGVGFDDDLPPRPDRDAVADFDALLAGLDPETARDMLCECLAGIALWQHQLRVQASRYANDARPRELFRIG